MLLIIFKTFVSTLFFYFKDSNAPIPAAFEQVGFIWAKWIVAIGGMFGLFAR